RWKKTHAEENEEQQKKRFKIEVVEEDEPKNTAFSNRLDYCSFRSALTGGGVTLETVLIPAGKFIMGTPKLVEPKDTVFSGQLILVLAGSAAFAFIVIIVTRSIHRRRRPQVSLRWLLVFVVMVGVAMLGAFRCWESTKAWRRYELAKRVGSNERPAHEVTLTTPFYISKFETTQEQYELVMGINRSRFKGSDLPVERFTWEELQAFCKKVSEKTRQTVRLPTEAQWEYACRAGTSTAYSSGDEYADLDRIGWYAANSQNTMHPVGQKEPNAWGVYDMHGNVWEHCQDWYEEYKHGAVVDPEGPPQGETRVLRGGSWDFSAGYCRSTFRHLAFNGFAGFRVVVEVMKKP
ncbi:MAG TPA: formylglycine-generating enzyme family protein, partial [Planctomycetota bacterium]